MNKKSWKKKRGTNSCDEIDGFDCMDNINKEVETEFITGDPSNKDQSNKVIEVIETGSTDEHVSMLAQDSCDSNNTENNDVSLDSENVSCGINNTENNDSNLTWEDTVLSEKDLKYY